MLSRSRGIALIFGVMLVALAGGCRAVLPAGGYAHELRSFVNPEIGTASAEGSSAGGDGDGVAGTNAGAGNGEPRVIGPFGVRVAEPVSEIIASFNADVPPGSGLTVEIACAAGNGGFTRFLRVASWGSVPELDSREHDIGAQHGCDPREPSPAAVPRGRVNIDELILATPVDRLRVRAVAFEGGGPVRVRRIDAVLTRPAVTQTFTPSVGDRIEWHVPFITNAAEDPDLRSRLCSPTSLNMLLNHRRPGIPHAEVVERVYSERFDLFGVWPRAIQTAWTFGVPGRLIRFADWDAVRAHLASVGPIAISITAKPGEVRGMPYESDSGHIIVLVGLTERGDAIVIDPAMREEREARRIYRAEDLTNVWLRRKRGTAYALDSLPIQHAVETPAGTGQGGVGIRE